MCSPFRRPGSFVILSIALGLLLMVPSTYAQNRTLTGKVVNDKGEPVQNAKIVISGVGSKRELSTKTDKKGEWVYMNIPTGTYRIVVRAEGFAPSGVDGVVPGIGFNPPINLTMVPGDPNIKLPFELSPEEQEKLKAEMEKQKERSKMAGEIQASFTAGRDFAALGKYPEAIAEFKKALEKAPDEVTVLSNLADAQMKNGQNDEALASYQKAIALKPDDAALYTNLGVILDKMGKREESQAAFEKAASLNPGMAAQNFYNLGATLVNSGQAKDAAAAFRKAIQADPNYADAYYQLGLCLSGDPESMNEAVQMLQKYLELGKNPDFIEVAKQLITVLKK